MIVDNKLVLGVVWQKGMDELKPGQQVMAIDDQDCSSVTLCNMLMNKPFFADKETATLTIKDEQGNIKKVQINKEKL